MFTSVRGWSFSVALVASLWGVTAQAGQIVVMDQTWVHAPDLADSHFRVPPMEGTPDNWVSPIDYSKGSAWVYLEVHTKPTQQETKFQVCFEATPTYACTNQSPIYTEVGTIEWETPFANFYQGNMVDWSKGTNKLACILKDTMNGKPSADNVGDEVSALYMPTEVRMVVTLVEAGSVYEPPIPSGEESTGGESTGGGGSTGGGDGTGGGESTGGGEATTTTTATGEPTTAEPTTAEPTTGGTGSTTQLGETGDPVPEPTTAPATTTDASTGGTGSTGGTSDGVDTDKSEGCGCVTPTGHDGRGSLALMALVLGLGLRRRAR